MAKKKKLGWGGRRKGAGPKFTGRNTVDVTFTIHKDDVDLIKAFVKEKRIELREKAMAGNKIEQPVNNLKVVKTNGRRLPGNDFLEKHRNQKLGIK